MKKLFWYDSETSGLKSDQQQMLTFAVVCTDISLNVLGKIYVQLKVLPHVVSEASALAINKLDPFSLTWFAESILEKDLCQNLISFYNEHKGDQNYWLAYNAKFDNGFLQAAFERNGAHLDLSNDVCVDPLLMCRKAVAAGKIVTPERLDRGGRPFRPSNLEAVSVALKTAHIGDAHNALNDVLCMIKTTPAALEAFTGSKDMEAFLDNQDYQIGF